MMSFDELKQIPNCMEIQIQDDQLTFWIPPQFGPRRGIQPQINDRGDLLGWQVIDGKGDFMRGFLGLHQALDYIWEYEPYGADTPKDWIII